MLGLPRCTHAPLHSREQAYVCLGGDSKFYHFFLLLDKILVLLFYFVFRQLRAALFKGTGSVPKYSPKLDVK